MKTPCGNIAKVRYQLEGIPFDNTGLFPLYQGYTVGDVVTIQPHLRDDKGLLMHELCHVDQYYKYKFFKMRYRFSKKFRVRCEVEGFAAQLEGNGGTSKLENYAVELSLRYNINKTAEECKVLILVKYRSVEDEK